MASSTTGSAYAPLVIGETTRPGAIQRWPQTKKENIHAIDTAEQSTETPPTEPTSAPNLMATPSRTTINAFGGHTIPHYGTCDLILSHHGHPKSYTFHVVNTVGPTILGLPTCHDMKLVTLNEGIATTQHRAAPMPNPQGNADAKSELLCQ